MGRSPPSSSGPTARCKRFAPRRWVASPSTPTTRVPPRSVPRPAGCTTAAAPRCTCALALALVCSSAHRPTAAARSRSAPRSPAALRVAPENGGVSGRCLCAAGTAHRQVQREAARGSQGTEGLWRLWTRFQVLGALPVAAPLDTASRACRLRRPRHFPCHASTHVARRELCAACGSNKRGCPSSCLLRPCCYPAEPSPLSASPVA